MEGLNVYMKEACDRHIFKDISLHHGGTLLSYLMYADDVLFMRGGPR